MSDTAANATGIAGAAQAFESILAGEIPDTETAPSTRPDWPRTGIAMQLIEGSFSSRSVAQPRSRTSRTSRRNTAGSVMVLGVRRTKSIRSTSRSTSRSPTTCKRVSAWP